MLKSAIHFLTFKCPYTCAYCYQGHHELQEKGLEKYRPIPYPESAQPTIDAWNKLKPGILDITGGEITNIPWWVDFIEGLDPAIKLGMTTNLGVDFTQFVQRVDPKKFVNITCSFHPSQNGSPKQPMNFYTFTGRALMLKHRGFPITINIVTWPEMLWLLDDYKAWFADRHGFKFHVDGYSSISYYPFVFSEKEKAYADKFLDAGRKPHPWAVQHGQNYQVDCSGGITHINVQPNGDAYRCVLEFQLDINKVGNIYDPDFKLFDKELPCNEHWRCPGCDRDKVLVKFNHKIDRQEMGLPIISI